MLAPWGRLCPRPCARHPYPCPCRFPPSTIHHPPPDRPSQPVADRINPRTVPLLLSSCCYPIPYDTPCALFSCPASPRVQSVQCPECPVSRVVSCPRICYSYVLACPPGMVVLVLAPVLVVGVARPLHFPLLTAIVIVSLSSSVSPSAIFAVL